MDIDSKLTNWLLQGDVSIQYQTYRDLFDIDKPGLQKKIEKQGWGKNFLDCKNGKHWGLEYYQPKWTSSHYTLLDLRNLNLFPENKTVQQTINLILKEELNNDGGVNPGKTVTESDVCLNGMFLNFAVYFNIEIEKLESIVDFILSQQLNDGGFNCMFNRSGAVHSSMHSTISCLEGLFEFQKKSDYRKNEIDKVMSEAKEFLLQHKLFKSDKSGELIKPEFIRFSYPWRWRYNILRAMDFFRASETPWDERMQDAIDMILSKRKKSGKWNVQAKHPGKQHFEMEKAGKESRWNTLIALRILKYYGVIRVC